MRRRLVWIQGGEKIYGIIYELGRFGLSFAPAPFDVSGRIQLSNPAPPFASTFDVTDQVGTSNLTIIQNTQSLIEANFSGGLRTLVLERSYKARNQLTVDVSLRLELLSQSDASAEARASVVLFEIEPTPQQIAQQSIILYGNDPIGTVREWSGTLTAP